MAITNEFVIKENALTKYVGPGGIVEIPEGVESIGWGAFSNRADVTEVIIPEGVKEISASAFEGCKELKKVMIPQSVTHIAVNAFAGTAWYRESANWKKNVLYMGDVLIKARASISGTYTVMDGTRLIADDAFKQCEKLTAVSIPSGVTDIGSGAFSCCTALAGLELPETVERIGREAFSSCKSLTSIRIPGSLKNIGQRAFSECEALVKAEFSEGAYIVGNAMFSYCKKLRYVVLPASMQEVPRDAFDHCKELTEIRVAEENPRFYDINGALILRNSKELYLAPRGIKGCYEIPHEVSSIGEEAFGGEYFSGCSGMTDVIIPETVTHIAKRAFQSCEGLTNITIPGSVLRIDDWAFSSCLNLTNITIQEGVKEIGDKAFFNCRKLKKITIPASMVLLHSQAFTGCIELECYDISTDHKTLQQKSGIVFSRDGSRLLFYPGKAPGVCRIPDGVKEVDTYAFENCKDLTELVLPRGIQALPDMVFYGCPRLNKVTVYNDYPGDNLGRLFGYYRNQTRDYMRPDCLVIVRDVHSDTVCYEVDLVVESNGIGFSLRGGAWGGDIPFAFKKIDNMFDSYKEMTNRLNAAYLRLKYPFDLDDATKDKYQKFIRRNGIKLLPNLIAASRADMIRDFLELGAVGKAKIDSLIEQATAMKNPEVAATLINYKKNHFVEGKSSADLSFDLSDKANKLWETKKGKPDLVWRYNGEDRELTFPTELNGQAIIGVDDTTLNKPDNYQHIEKLVIPEGYRSIGKNAFSGCKRLKEVILPQTLISIGENAFTGCLSLKEIVLPSSAVTLGAGCFANCQALEKVGLSERLKQIPDRAFFQCIKLEKIDFPRGLFSIGNEAFRSCQTLREIDLGKEFRYLGDKSFYMAGLETVIFRGKKCTACSGICFSYPRYVFTDGEIDALGIPRTTWMPLSYLGLKNEELVNTAGDKLLEGLTVYGLGTLKAFPKLADYRYSNMTFPEFITRLGGNYSNALNKTVDLVVTFAIDPENATIRCAQKQGIAIINEEDFLKIIQKKERPQIILNTIKTADTYNT